MGTALSDYDSGRQEGRTGRSPRRMAVPSAGFLAGLAALAGGAWLWSYYRQPALEARTRKRLTASGSQSSAVSPSAPGHVIPSAENIHIGT